MHYDLLLAELVARDATRDEAVGRMARALEACALEGVKTTVPFLARVMAHAGFRRGEVHTQMVEEGAFDG